MIKEFIHRIRYVPEAITRDVRLIDSALEVDPLEIERALETQAYRAPFIDTRPHAYVYRAVRKETGERVVVSGLSISRDRWAPRSKFQNDIRAWRKIVQDPDRVLLSSQISGKPARIVLDVVARGLTKLLTRDMPKRT